MWSDFESNININIISALKNMIDILHSSNNTDVFSVKARNATMTLRRNAIVKEAIRVIVLSLDLAL